MNMNLKETQKYCFTNNLCIPELTLACIESIDTIFYFIIWFSKILSKSVAAFSKHMFPRALNSLRSWKRDVPK